MSAPARSSLLFVLEFAFHLAIVIFALAGYLINQTQPDAVVLFPADTTNRVLYLVFCAQSAIAIAICVLMPLFYKETKDIVSDMYSAHAGYEGLNNTTNLIIFQDFINITRRTLTLFIIRMALGEAVAIFGFVLTVLTHSFYTMLPFALVAFVLQFLFGPLYANARKASGDTYNMNENNTTDSAGQ